MELTRHDTIRAAVGLITGGPVGMVVSPVVGRAFNGKWTPWAVVGVFVAPITWVASLLPIALLTYNPSTVTTPAQPGQPPVVPTASPAPTVQSEAAADAPLNTAISDNLNAADQMFKNNMDGCSNVSLALTAANNPNIYGPTSPAQRAELKSYAQRCNFRF